MSNDFAPPGGPAPAGPPAPEPARPAGAPAPRYSAAAPYGSHQPVAPIAPPKLVDIAFWLSIAAAALSLIAVLVSIASLDEVREQALRELEAQGQGDVLPPEAIEGIIWTSFAFGLIFSLLFAAAYVIFAILMRRGYGWARWVLLAFAVLSVFGVISPFGLGALQFLCLAAATVLVFLPASRAYFQSAKQARAGRSA